MGWRDEIELKREARKIATIVGAVEAAGAEAVVSADRRRRLAGPDVPGLGIRSAQTEFPCELCREVHSIDEMRRIVSAEVGPDPVRVCFSCDTPDVVERIQRKHEERAVALREVEQLVSAQRFADMEFNPESREYRFRDEEVETRES